MTGVTFERFDALGRIPCPICDGRGCSLEGVTGPSATICSACRGTGLRFPTLTEECPCTGGVTEKCPACLRETTPHSQACLRCQGSDRVPVQYDRLEAVFDALGSMCGWSIQLFWVFELDKLCCVVTPSTAFDEHVSWGKTRLEAATNALWEVVHGTTSDV